MELQKIRIKTYGNNGGTELQSIIPVFHNWIQNKSCEELLIDVADYSHVPAGPGVMLIGDEANLSIEYGAEEAFGIVYSTKEKRTGENSDRIRHALRQLLKSAALLAGDERLRNVEFPGQAFRMLVNSRESATNNDSTLKSIQSDLNLVFDQLFGDSRYTMERLSNDRRERFMVEVRHESPQDINSLLGRIR